MPKRPSKFYVDLPDCSFRKRMQRRKSIVDNEQVLNDNDDIENEDGPDSGGLEEVSNNVSLEGFPRPKTIRRLKYNQNHEIERLLQHNSSNLYYTFSHNLFPSFNVGLWPQMDENKLLTYPSCAFNVPRPIYISDVRQELIDLCYRRPKAKESYRFRMQKSKTSYHTAKKRNKNTSAEELKGVYQTTVYEIAERLAVQPDPYFQASYDYYYTGGNLCVIPQTERIMHASGPNLQTLELTEFPMVEDYTLTSYLSSVAKLTPRERCEIFEIKPMVLPSSENKNCFISRQRNCVTISYLNEDKQLNVLKDFLTPSTPFISFAQSERDYSKLLVTTMKQHIQLYDVGAESLQLVQLFKIEPEAVSVGWNMVKPWRENTFLYTNEYNFCLIDVRTTPTQWMSSATSIIENHYLCDHITAIQPSAFSNMFYIATNHKLHCMDIRYIKGSSSFSEPGAVVCRWSHQLEYSPLLLDTYRLLNNEYIALSSPLSGDLHICQLSRQRNDEQLPIQVSQRVPHHIYKSPCMPYQPPTFVEAYDRARLEGNCLQSDSNLRNRIMACTTGMSFCKSALGDKGPALGLLLTSNSLGDIFLQTLTKREEMENDARSNARSTEIMVEFAKKLTVQKQPLNYTYLKNMKAMRKVFLSKYLNTAVKNEMDDLDDSYSETEQIPPPEVLPGALPPKKKRKRLHFGRWQKSLSKLHSYKDALVPDLLSIWDIELDDEKDGLHLGSLQNSRNIKPDSEIKVQNWLASSMRPNAPMVNIPNKISTNLNEVLVTALGNDENISLNETNISMDFEHAVQSTQIINASACETTFNIHNNSTLHLNTTAGDIEVNTTLDIVVDSMKKKKKVKKFVKGF
uniref:TATA box-binding protein-associated factor RNA polymerase I subunit C n=1 Tax=Stomoxys calcitrans TaxID=35570 RepID=A0A1I8NQK7_STOCA